jgi:hypothetical protein
MTKTQIQVKHIKDGIRMRASEDTDLVLGISLYTGALWHLDKCGLLSVAGKGNKDTGIRYVGR